MSLSNCLAKGLSRFLGSPSRARSKVRRVKPSAKHRVRLAFEVLEDRAVPTLLIAPHFGLPNEMDDNGQKLSSIPIHLMYYGTYWANTPSVGDTAKPSAAEVTAAIQNLVGSAYLSGLTQYGVDGRASVDSSVLIVNNDPPTNFSKGDLDGKINEEMYNGNLPASFLIVPVPIPFPPFVVPQALAVGDGIYVVLTPPNVSSNQETGASNNGVGFSFNVFPGSSIEHRIWLAGLPANGIPQNASVLDFYTTNFSHELAEIITDPLGNPQGAAQWALNVLGLGAGIVVTPNQNYPPDGGTDNQVCDAEAQLYTYRIPDGASSLLVQSYWSQQDQAYEIPDGTPEQFFLTPINPTNANTLTGPVEQYTLAFSASNERIDIGQTATGGVQITINGTDSVQFDPGQITSITLNLGPGTNSVNVNKTLSGVPVTINQSGGTDVVNISPSAENLDNIQGTVTVNGGLGTDTLNVDDQNNASDATWTMNAGSVTRTGAGTIFYGGINAVNINGGSGTLTYNIRGTEGVFTTTLNAGAGSDTVNVQATGAFSTLNINNGLSTSNDTVNIGSSAPSLGGTLANIAGAVNVSNASGHTTLNVDDSGDSFGQRFAITNGSITGTWSTGAINYSNTAIGGISALNIFGGSGGNTFNVQSTLAATTTSINTDDVTSVNSANNTVNVGSNAPSLSGTLANIAGPIKVSNTSGTTALVVDDSGDTTGQTFAVTNNSITGTWSSAAINYTNTTFGHISSVSLLGGSGGNTFNVQSTSGTATTSINTDDVTTVNNANNTVNVGSNAPSLGGTLANIAGPINVSNTSGTTALVVDDSGDTAGQTFAVTNNSITGTWSSGAINYTNTTFGRISSVSLLGGSGGNTFNVQSTAIGTVINAGAGGDTVNVGSAANTLDPILGSVNVVGAGNTTLNVNDLGTTTNNNWEINAASIDRYLFGGLPPAVPQITYHNLATVTVTAGTARTFINIHSTAAGTTIVNGNNSGDEFIVGDSGERLDEIQAPLMLHGSGLDFLSAVDIGNTVGHNYTVTTGQLQRDGKTLFTYDGMGEFILSTANSNFGHTPSTVTVQSLNVVFAALALAKGDSVTVGNGSLAAIQGDLRIQGVIGQTPKQITLDDSTDPTPRTTTPITLSGNDPTFGYVVGGLLPNGGRIGFLSLDATTPVSILGGPADDVFKIHDFTGAPAITINAEPATSTRTNRHNKLDYSTYTGDVTVNLNPVNPVNPSLGTATGLAGISGIQDVTGGIGNSLLVGDAGANILVGGTLRNILIGGAGADTLTGSVNQDNILIGGTTLWDTNLPDLMLIMHEWLRTDLNFDQRFSDINSGGVGITGSVLTGTGVALNKTTVFHDNSPDTLNEPTTNLTGRYWFFIDADDIVPFSKNGKTGDKFTKV